MQGCCYSCVVATPDSRALYVVGSDKKLKELEEVGGTGTQVTKELDTGTTVNSIALPAGTAMVQYTQPCLSRICMGCVTVSATQGACRGANKLAVNVRTSNSLRPSLPSPTPLRSLPYGRLCNPAC